jgi:hypothetical protein
LQYISDKLLTSCSAAFLKWTKDIPIAIVPASSAAEIADIYVCFRSMGASIGYYAITRMAAAGDHLDPGLVYIAFNDDYDWSDERLFNYTAVHEIGHSTGLSHTKVEDAIMWPYYMASADSLRPDDEAGAHSLYGWR